MPSLARCIELAGISGVEADRLFAAAKAYRDEGFSAGEANQGAVRDAIADLESERADIFRQVESQIGPPAERPESEAAKPQKPTAKLPWMMSLKDYLESQKVFEQRDQEAATKAAKSRYVNSIKLAQADGESIPQEALDDYNQLTTDPVVDSDGGASSLRPDKVVTAKPKTEPKAPESLEAAPAPGKAKEPWEMKEKELAKSVGAESAFVDNPGGGWLEGEIEAAKGGGSGAKTAGVEGVMIPVDDLISIDGKMGEHDRIGHDDPRVMALAEKIKKEGFTSEIFINVEWDGSATINEGNHRVRAAKLAGLDKIPVEVAYYAGGERKPGPMSLRYLSDLQAGQTTGQAKRQNQPKPLKSKADTADKVSDKTPDQPTSTGKAVEANNAATKKQPPIARYRKIAKAIESNIEPVAEGRTRLWRGNRPGEVGAATRFTSDLPGIALPFREAYGGKLSYVDVDTEMLGTYENELSPAEYNVPDAIARGAKTVDLASETTDSTRSPSDESAKPKEPKAEIDNPGILIEKRVREKYADIAKLPEVGGEDNSPVADLLEKIDNGEATPEAVSSALNKIKDQDTIELAKTHIRSAVADQIGNLIETHRYESHAEGRQLEKYLDKILQAVERHTVPEALPKAKVRPENRRAKDRSAEKSGGLSDDQRVKRSGQQMPMFKRGKSGQWAQNLNAHHKNIKSQVESITKDWANADDIIVRKHQSEIHPALLLQTPDAERVNELRKAILDNVQGKKIPSAKIWAAMRKASREYKGFLSEFKNAGLVRYLYEHREDKFIDVDDALNSMVPSFARGGAFLGKIYIVSENTVPDTVEHTLFHEVNHVGIELIENDQVMGPRYKRWEQDLISTRKDDLSEIADEYRLDMRSDKDRKIAAKEWLSRQAEKGKPDNLFYRFVRMVKDWARRVFKGLRVSNQEAYAWIADARNAVVRGRAAGGRLVEAPAFSGGPRMSYAGQKAKTADKSALAKAVEMEQSGKDMVAIRKETGWFLGMDDRWRFEVDDSEATWKPNADGDKIRLNDLDPDHGFDDEIKLPEIIDHPQLFEAYPVLENVNVRRDSSMPGVGASYDGTQKTIYLAPDNFTYKGAGQNKELLLHEIQHAIQEIEGFARGGDPATVSVEDVLKEDPKLKGFGERMDGLSWDGFDWNSNEMKAVRAERDAYIKSALKDKYGDDYGMGVYQRLAGEIEARDTADRSGLTQDQRKAQKPYVSQGIPKEEVIIRFGEAGVPMLSKVSATERAEPQQSQIDRAREALRGPFNDFMYWVVDKNRPIQSVQNKLSKVRDEIDVFLKETMRPKVAANKVLEFQQAHVEPLIKAMAESGVSLPDLELYAHAMHAGEANESLRTANAKRYVGKISSALPKTDQNKITIASKDLKSPEEWYNFLEGTVIPKYGDKAEKVISGWKAFKEKPSGMSDEEAQKTLSEYSKDKAYHKKIEQLRLMVSAINEERLELLYNAGQIPGEEYRSIKKKYKYYVPLMREGYNDKLFGVPRGIKPSGKSVKVRGGSTRKVVNIVANSIANYERAVNVAEKAVSQRALYGLIKENPENETIDISPVKESPAYDSNGNIRMYPDLSSVGDNEMRLMIGGEQHLVSVDRDDKDAMLMLRTLKAEDSMHGPIMGVLSNFNRYLAKINTSWSPEFIISNFVRDIQTAGINIKDTEVKSKGMFRGAVKAWKAVYRVESGKPKGTELEALYRRYRRSGGKINWSDVHGSVESLAKSITKDIETEAGNKPIRKTIKGWLDLIDNANTAIENGVRLHAFKLAVEQGKSDERAAQIASDLTVDFTKKGAAGPAINSLYLFANAGIQGSYRILRAASKSSAVRKHLSGIVAAGFVVGVLNSLAGDDDDGEDYFNKIDDYLRERNAIIMLPGTDGKYVKIPLPWGYNFVWNIGTELSRAFTKEQYRPMAGAGRLASTFANAFNPVASGTILQTISPTITDPFVMVAENKNWFGGELMPEENKFSRVKTPDSQRYWKSTGDVPKWVASAANRLTGGDVVRSGGIDISPETLNLVADTLGGSALRFFRDSINIPYSLVTKEEISSRKIPFFRVVAGGKSEWSDSKAYYHNSSSALELEERLKAYRGTEYYSQLRRANKDIVGLIEKTKLTERSLKRLRKIRKAAEASGNKKSIDRINVRINNLYSRYNGAYYSALNN